MDKKIYLQLVVLSLCFRKLLSNDSFISICKAIKQMQEGEE